VSGLGDEIAKIFSQVLYLCDREGLIGREMFAIDGVKLPSNAAMSKSGKRAEFERQTQKLEKAAKKAMLVRHRVKDAAAVEADLCEKEARRKERVQREARKLRRSRGERNGTDDDRSKTGFSTASTFRVTGRRGA